MVDAGRRHAAATEREATIFIILDGENDFQVVGHFQDATEAMACAPCSPAMAAMFIQPSRAL